MCVRRSLAWVLTADVRVDRMKVCVGGGGYNKKT